MLLRLLVLFLVVPFVELALLLFIADRTSWLFTLGLVIVTGVAGSLLARSQGFRTIRRIQSEVAEGRMPADALLDTLLIFVAGALLLTPGVLTDAFGILLLLPPTRGFFRRRMVAWVKRRFRVDAFTDGAGAAAWTATFDSSSPGRSAVLDSRVIDAASPPPDGQGTSRISP